MWRYFVGDQLILKVITLENMGGPPQSEGLNDEN